MRLKNRKNIIYIMLGVYFLIFLWLFHREFAPFGIWETSKYTISPEYRIDESGTIKETPVYFTIDNPRRFDKAIFKAKISGSAPIVYAGVVRSADPWIVDQKMIYNEYLENLSWNRVQENGFILWQRNNKYGSVKEFLENPPSIDKLAVANASIDAVLNNYSDQEFFSEYSVSFRGSQDMFLYTAGKDIKIDFIVHDVNRHDGADPVKIELKNNSGVIVADESLEDDGIVWGTREHKDPRLISIEYKNPEQGAYRLIFSASDDVFIRKIKTNQNKMVWKGMMYIGDEVGYRNSAVPLTVWSNSQGYAMDVPHPESLQKVSFGDIDLDIVEYGKQYETRLPKNIAGDLASIQIPKRDLRLSGDGFFALSRESFFIPTPIQFQSDLDLDRLGVDFVFAEYDIPKKNKVSAEFDVSGIDQLQFILSQPPGQGGDIKVESLSFALRKAPLTIMRIFSKIKELAYDG